MFSSKTEVNRSFTAGRIDPRLFGSFVEHMGRVVYTGIYEKDHPTADEEGWRRDVIELTKKMGVTAARYPGGNFVSGYDWMDGIGPREKRPRKRSLAWKSIETNEIGIDEFMHWAKKADVEPILAVNLGSKGLEEAAAFLEYCNLDPGTLYSDMRAAYASEKPYGVRIWCLGNEMDGDWQIGHKTAEEYGRIAHETGKVMKILDPSIELVVCGSSLSSNPTVGDWDRTVIRHTFDQADYISLHQYYGGQEKGTAAFLAQSLDLDRYIRMVTNICDAEAAMRRIEKKVMIALDEWGVWSVPSNEVEQEVGARPWQIAPAVGEQIYTMEDALLFASMMISMLRHADRVKIGCQSLLTNVSACIMTEPGGDAWVQPDYHVFSMIAGSAGGAVLREVSEEETYSAEGFSQVPLIDHVCVYHEAAKELVIYLVNRQDRPAEAAYHFGGFNMDHVTQSRILTSADIKNTNRKDHNLVHPEDIDNVRIQDGSVICELQPYSFQMVRLALA